MLAHQDTEFVALIPAAGQALRLGKLPCSKELIPVVPGVNDPFAAPPGTKVAIEETLEVLAANGIGSAIVIITADKQDIPAYLGDGSAAGVSVSYVTRDNSPSVPHTLCSAIPALARRSAVLVFPDILFRPRDAIARLMARHAECGADVTLALVPTERGDKVDIVETGAAGRLSKIAAKPGPGHGGWTWIAAAWGKRFSAYLADYVARADPENRHELHVGDVLNAACRSGLTVVTLHIPEGKALDIGTPDDLQRLWQHGLQGVFGP